MSEQPEVRNLRELNSNLKKTFENDERFWTVGVVKGVIQKPSGYIHFTLDDEKSYSIECTISERVWKKLSLSIKSQMKVEVYGTWRIWEQRAQLQFQIERINVLLNSTSNDVIERLKAQGLLRETIRFLPPVINRLVLITGKNSRALDDFYIYYKQRERVKEIYVSLEGSLAAREIADAINQVNANAEADVIALIRGGGHRDDLDTFNDYLVAEAISNSSIIVVTGIGHQGDETIADRVADFSFSTPTAVGMELAKASSAQTLPPAIVNPIPAKSSSWQTVILLVIGFMVALALLIFAISQLGPVQTLPSLF
jgi:exodeoxyribonuclease VII large subunit